MSQAVDQPHPPPPPASAGPGRPSRKGRSTGRGTIAAAQRKEAIALALPALVPIVVFSVIPLLSGIYLGFTDSTLRRNHQTQFTGLDNYRRLLEDERFWNSFKIGLIWATSVSLLTLLSALGLALLLNSDMRFKGLTRVLALIPWAMPPVVVAIMWRMIYSPTNGPLTAGLGALGLPAPNWLGDFDTALPAVIVVAVWAGTPQTAVLLLAGLQSIAPEQHEAAAVDGAGALRRLWHVTLPGLRPIMIAVTSLDFIWSFNTFGLVYVMTEGGPGGKTMLPMLFTYLEAFRNRETGYASAMGNVLVIAVVLMLSFYLLHQLRRNQEIQR